MMLTTFHDIFFSGDSIYQLHHDNNFAQPYFKYFYVELLKQVEYNFIKEYYILNSEFDSEIPTRFFLLLECDRSIRLLFLKLMKNCIQHIVMASPN